MAALGYEYWLMGLNMLGMGEIGAGIGGGRRVGI
jgi:hypothetical protein